MENTFKKIINSFSQSAQSRELLFVYNWFLSIFSLLLFLLLLFFFGLRLLFLSYFLLFVAGLNSPSDENPGRFIQWIFLSSKVSLVLLFELSDSWDASFYVSVEISRFEFPIFVKIESDLLKFLEWYFFEKRQMDFVLLSSFKY